MAFDAHFTGLLTSRKPFSTASRISADRATDVHAAQLAFGVPQQLGGRPVGVDDVSLAVDGVDHVGKLSMRASKILSVSISLTSVLMIIAHSFATRSPA
jgi:hypothetical protein